MSSSDVQTMANLDGEAPDALQTPLYPIISLFGLLIVLGSFLTWAQVDNPDEGAISTSINGLDAGGWGLSALIVGIAITALGVLGYFWNPFSDPEAAFIAAFGLAAVVAALAKIADPVSLFHGDVVVDYLDPSVGIGLWLILVGAVLSFLGGIWILYSRPSAAARLAS